MNPGHSNPELSDRMMRGTFDEKRNTIIIPKGVINLLYLKSTMNLIIVTDEKKFATFTSYDPFSESGEDQLNCPTEIKIGPRRYEFMDTYYEYYMGRKKQSMFMIHFLGSAVQKPSSTGQSPDTTPSLLHFIDG